MFAFNASGFFFSTFVPQARVDDLLPLLFDGRFPVRVLDVHVHDELFLLTFCGSLRLFGGQFLVHVQHVLPLIALVQYELVLLSDVVLQSLVGAVYRQFLLG